MADTREREISGQTVRIDRTLCIGSGNCTNIAPEIYVIREDNIVDELPVLVTVGVSGGCTDRGGRGGGADRPLARGG